MDKFIIFSINWKLPNSDKIIVDNYILSVPTKISKSYYSWVSSKRKLAYKTHQFINRLRKTIN